MILAEPYVDIPELPRNGYELAGWGMLALITVSVAVVAAVYLWVREQRSTSRDVADTKAVVVEMREQVCNNHTSSNMRDDIDGIPDKIAADIASLRDLINERFGYVVTRIDEQSKDIKGCWTEIGMVRGDDRALREEIGATRNDLRSLERRTSAALRRNHPDDPIL